MSLQRTATTPVWLWGACVLALASACSDDTDSSSTGDDNPGTVNIDPPADDNPMTPVVPGDGETDFISDVAGQTTDGDAPTDAAGGDPAPSAEADDGAGGAERAIAEADIIQVDGDRLYALSRYAGMTIVDISDPSDLKVAGTYRSAATPFEMYLRDGVAYLMLNGYWTYVYDEVAQMSVWGSTARMQALNVQDPANIEVIGDYEVVGDISDSRMVGDVIYLVTYQNGWCWGCEQMPNTRIASFDAADPQSFEKIDELRFENEEYGWGQRSISVTSQRMYVAGPHWSERNSGGTIQVVDIADPQGSIELGAEVNIAGVIDNRWQMDEHNDVLRVISQVGGWNSDAPPVIETFTVESSDSVTALGSLSMVLPRPESLMSVRFDGERAYAITFERTDPLFTIDLADPATPRQMGELEIPGWVYHMEPRGDRVYGLGFDDAAEGRGLTVSIFDVSDMTTPTMTDRVVFGGNWARMAEDQDRIHKAFNLMLDRGLILVPFSGGDYDEDNCNYEWQSGIQIIDVAGDTLTLRGVAPQIGDARRSLLRDDNTLLAVSDNAIQSFDIADRDAPSALDKLEVARNITQIEVMGEDVLRFGNDWWTGRTLLDFASVDAAGTPEPNGELDLSMLFDDEQDQCNSYSHWGGGVYRHGDYAYVPRYQNRWGDEGNGWSEENRLTFYIVDISDRSNPRLAGNFEVPAATSRGGGGNDYQYEYFGDILLTDSALLVGRTTGSYNYNPDTGDRQTPEHHYDIFSLADPAAPTLTTRFEVPSSIAGHGWGYGAIGCGMDIGWGWWYPSYGSPNALVSGDIVASNHEEALDDDTGRVRYFLDRLDVSDPANPRMLTSINIPGQVSYFDAARGFLVTLEDDLRTEPASDWDDCGWQSSRSYFVRDEGVCRIFDRHLNALVLDGDTARRVSRINLDEERVSRSIAISDERVFVLDGERARYDRENPTPITRQVRSFAIADNGQLQSLPALDLEPSNEYWWWPRVAARGARAFITVSNSLQVVDTTDKPAPSLVEHQMPGWNCGSLQVRDDTAYCAMGQQGVLTFDL